MAAISTGVPGIEQYSARVFRVGVQIRVPTPDGGTTRRWLR